jgi:hypothetical protein
MTVTHVSSGPVTSVCPASGLTTVGAPGRRADKSRATAAVRSVQSAGSDVPEKAVVMVAVVSSNHPRATALLPEVGRNRTASSASPRTAGTRSPGGRVSRASRSADAGSGHSATKSSRPTTDPATSGCHERVLPRQRSGRATGMSGTSGRSVHTPPSTAAGDQPSRPCCPWAWLDAGSRSCVSSRRDVTPAAALRAARGPCTPHRTTRRASRGGGARSGLGSESRASVQDASEILRHRQTERSGRA